MDKGRSRLREIMKEKGVGVKELSEKCGIKERTLYRRLSGESRFCADEIWNISCALEIDNIKEIFFD